MKKLIVSLGVLLAGLMVSSNPVLAHHGTADDYWHVYWGESTRDNVQYEYDNVDDSGGYYSVYSSIYDWNSSQNHVDLTSWDSSKYLNPWLTYEALSNMDMKSVMTKNLKFFSSDIKVK